MNNQPIQLKGHKTQLDTKQSIFALYLMKCTHQRQERPNEAKDKTTTPILTCINCMDFVCEILICKQSV